MTFRNAKQIVESDHRYQDHRWREFEDEHGSGKAQIAQKTGEIWYFALIKDYETLELLKLYLNGPQKVIP